jgi:hypothetical protein
MAGNRLRVKTAAARVSIFGVAVFIQRPGLHRRIAPVVRKITDDAKTWTTVRAVYIGIPVAPVSWIKELSQTSIADREVGGNASRRPLAPFALSDGEIAQTDRGCGMYFDVRDACCRGRLRLQVLNKSPQS